MPEALLSPKAIAVSLGAIPGALSRYYLTVLFSFIQSMVMNALSIWHIFD
jgi:fluoride ion exporter CrcB/FEX